MSRAGLLASLLGLALMGAGLLPPEAGLPVSQGEPPIQAQPQPPGSSQSDETAIELAFWNTVKDTDDPAILQTYLDRYPNGAFAALARAMMDRLLKEQPATESRDGGRTATAETAPETRFITLRATLKAKEGTTPPQPQLGMRIAPVTDAWAKAVGLADAKGALVVSSVEGSPAELAGAQAGDVVVKFGDTTVNKFSDLPKLVAEKPVGAEIDVEVWRTGNGAGDLVSWLRRRADAGDAVAIKSLAYAYGFELAGLNDPHESVSWNRKAAELGDTGAMNNLGAAYTNGKGVSKNESEATNWYRKSAELGDARGMYWLGIARAQGIGVTKDEAEALRWFKKAAAAGDPVAMVAEGFYYEKGKGGVGKDEAQAVRLYRQAADLGDLEGMTSLAVMLFNGAGVPKDEAEAVRLLRKAAGSGHARALLILAGLTLQGEGTAKDPAEAARLFRAGADLGNSDAMTALANQYLNGDGVAKDMNEAMKLYRQAAEKRHPAALFGIGWLYETGNGVGKDEREGLNYYRQAAELGHTGAMSNLSAMLQAGRGGPANTEEAATWMYRALAGGDAVALKQIRSNSASFSLAFRKALQRQLKEKGLYSGPIDGKFGPSTFTALDNLAKSN